MVTHYSASILIHWFCLNNILVEILFNCFLEKNRFILISLKSINRDITLLEIFQLKKTMKFLTIFNEELHIFLITLKYLLFLIFCWSFIFTYFSKFCALNEIIFSFVLVGHNKCESFKNEIKEYFLIRNSYCGYLDKN
jgi:hypothetical protein